MDMQFLELLLESRLNIAAPGGISAMEGKLRFVQGKPKLHESPVLAGDNHADETGASIYGTVLRDGGVSRMWYQAWPKDWDGEDVTLVGYAESCFAITTERRAGWGCLPRVAAHSREHRTDHWPSSIPQAFRP